MNAFKFISLSLLLVSCQIISQEPSQTTPQQEQFETSKDKFDTLSMLITLRHDEEYNHEAWNNLITVFKELQNHARTCSWEHPRLRKAYSTVLETIMSQQVNSSIHASVSIFGMLGSSCIPTSPDTLRLSLSITKAEQHDTQRWQQIIDLTSAFIKQIEMLNDKTQEKIMVERYFQVQFDAVALSIQALDRFGLKPELEVKS